MTNFEVSGLFLPNCMTAVEKLVLLLEATSLESEKFCLEAHLRDIDSVKALATAAPSCRYACYCWKRLSEFEEFRRPEFLKLGRARIKFPRQGISIDQQPSLPPYNWEGEPNPLSNVAYIETQEDPAVPEFREASQSTIQVLTEISTGLNPNIEMGIKTSTTRSDTWIEHWYWLRVPIENVHILLERLFDRFSLRTGVGTFEFLGTVDQIQKLRQDARYEFENFPRGLASFNAAVGKTPFALECASFRYPVLNITRKQINDVAVQVDALGKQMVRCCINRKYLPWRVGNGMFSPRTQGNYALISSQQRGYLMFAGLEQFADGDPSIKQFTSSATPILEKLGMKLKRVAYFR